MPKITLGVTGSPEISGRDYGIEKPYWDPLNRFKPHPHESEYF